MGSCKNQDSSIHETLIGTIQEKTILIDQKNIILIDQGRKQNEKVAIQIKEGEYYGYAYLDQEDGYLVEDILEAINPQKNYAGMNKIISTFINHAKLKMIEY